MIVHVDMDAFYASVEEREDPSLVGRPVVVGGAPEGRGVVAAANYEARRYGIHSAMSAARAKRLCPQVVFLAPRIDYYAAVSRQIRAILDDFTPLVEPLSLDEAFLDVTGSEALFGNSAAIGRQIKQRIRDELRLVASVGVAPNKFLAKVASDVCKPDGFLVVEADRVRAFLDPLPVGRLWGVGKVAGRTFEKYSIRTIGELRQLPIETLKEIFGSLGEHFWQLANGIDHRRVTPDRDAKSISNETTFETDIDDDVVLRAWLIGLVEQVARRMRRHDIRGRTIELKVRLADFTTTSRSMTLAEPTNITHELLEAGLELLTRRLPPRRLAVRLLGFGVSNLETPSATQRHLFDEPDRRRHQQLDRIADQLTEKFGSRALRRAARLERSED